MTSIFASDALLDASPDLAASQQYRADVSHLRHGTSHPNASVPYFLNFSGEYFAHAENEYLEWLIEGAAVGSP